MEKMEKAKQEQDFTNVWTTDRRILFKRLNENKSNVFYD